MKILTLIASIALVATILSSVARAEQGSAEPATEKPAEAAVLVLAREIALLRDKLKALEGCSITSGNLAARNCRRLKDVAADIRVQRQGMADFEGYVKWMSLSLIHI